MSRISSVGKFRHGTNPDARTWPDAATKSRAAQVVITAGTNRAFTAAIATLARTGDDTVEPLPDILDFGAVMIEALALALPGYPHTEGMDLVNATFAAPGAAPLIDGDTRPFASLSALRDKLEKPDGWRVKKTLAPRKIRSMFPTLFAGMSWALVERLCMRR